MNNYQKRVLETRKLFLNLVKGTEKNIIKVYSKAAKELEEKLRTVKVGSKEERYLSSMKRELDNYVKVLRKDLKKELANGIKEASSLAAGIQTSFFDNILEQSVEATFKQMFSTIADEAVKQMVASGYYKDGKTLDTRLWNLTKKNAEDIENLITTNIAKGSDSRELAKLLDKYINPKKILKQDYVVKGMDRNISYQATRLARTSLKHAFDESYRRTAGANPFTKGIKWNLSPSHYDRQVKKWGKDICDVYATQNDYNLGVGVFPADKLPISHPNCLCNLTTETTDLKEARKELADWVKGGKNEKLDAWMETYGKEYGIEL